MSNPVIGESTAWDEPLPDLTWVEWAEVGAGCGDSALGEVLANLEGRSMSAMAFYDDTPLVRLVD
ncbi:hypothetical protein ABT147_32845 [Streptomyces sp. NPDC001868]|uniref:hypothetical protein n=1 Tax=Streptomyces sp. NPDC001868 TaxID=3154401 RepID=UPI00331AFE96